MKPRMNTDKDKHEWQASGTSRVARIPQPHQSVCIRVHPRFQALFAFAIILFLGGCEKPAPQYDTSTPQAALDSMRAMVRDGHPELLGSLLHIEARDIAFDDGVTEASAINEVLAKSGDMLGRLYRVAGTLRERFPDDLRRELAPSENSLTRDRQFLARFMSDPFGLLDEQADRLTVEDLGDGTAAVLIDGQPALGFGLQMRDMNGSWKIDIPIELLQKYRPNTRNEWAVVASMMLAMENALITFETELDRGEFRDLRHASDRAGRLLGERVFVQVMIYQGMKENATPATE